jgi:hypothetical protein
MELEVESLTGAAQGERSADRIDHRNGTAIAIARPQSNRACPSSGRGAISGVHTRGMAEKALVAVVQEASSRAYQPVRSPN